MSENQNDIVGWGSTKVTYEIMTDKHGQEWCVPTSIDGEPCEYLRKRDPELERLSRLNFTSIHPTPERKGEV